MGQQEILDYLKLHHQTHPGDWLSVKEICAGINISTGSAGAYLLRMRKQKKMDYYYSAATCKIMYRWKEV